MIFGGALRPLRFPKCFNKVALSFGKTEKFDKCCTGLTPNGGRARAQKGATCKLTTKVDCAKKLCKKKAKKRQHVNFKPHSIKNEKDDVHIAKYEQFIPTPLSMLDCLKVHRVFKGTR